jgi:hypothetical protein
MDRFCSSIQSDSSPKWLHTKCERNYNDERKSIFFIWFGECSVWKFQGPHEMPFSSSPIMNTVKKKSWAHNFCLRLSYFSPFLFFALLIFSRSLFFALARIHIARRRQPGQNKEDRTGRTREGEKDREETTGGQDGRTGQVGQDREVRTGRGQEREQDRERKGEGEDRGRRGGEERTGPRDERTGPGEESSGPGGERTGPGGERTGLVENSARRGEDRRETE